MLDYNKLDKQFNEILNSFTEEKLEDWIKFDNERLKQMKNQLELFYSVVNNGDGSASVMFFLSKKLADIHQEFKNLDCGWGEHCVGTILLESDSEITVRNKIITKEELLKNITEELEYCEEIYPDESYPDLEELIKRLNNLK